MGAGSLFTSMLKWGFSPLNLIWIRLLNILSPLSVVLKCYLTGETGESEDEWPWKYWGDGMSAIAVLLRKRNFQIYIYIGVVLAIGRVRKGLELSLESLLSSITTLLVHFSHPPVCCGMETCRLHSGTAIALCHCHLCSHKDLADSQSPSSAGISVPMGHRTSRHFPAVA